MNAKKEFLLKEIRLRYERKFGHSEESKKWIDLELEKLAKKDKLTLEVCFISTHLLFRTLKKLRKQFQ